MIRFTFFRELKVGDIVEFDTIHGETEFCKGIKNHSQYQLMSKKETLYKKGYIIEPSNMLSPADPAFNVYIKQDMIYENNIPLIPSQSEILHQVFVELDKSSDVALHIQSPEGKWLQNIGSQYIFEDPKTPGLFWFGEISTNKLTLHLVENCPDVVFKFYNLSDTDEKIIIKTRILRFRMKLLPEDKRVSTPIRIYHPDLISQM